MSYKQAILTRQSRRSFTKELPTIDQIKRLRECIEKTNDENGLNIQLMIDEEAGFSSFKSCYGVLTGVKNYIALVGPKEDENIHEKLGYFGEKLLLECENLGMGTCWVGGTFDREQCRCKVEEDEAFHCVIAFGNVKKNQTPKEKIMRNVFHTLNKTKKIENLFYSENDTVPNWFIEGMRMVQRAPSAINRMPVMFYYSYGNVYAKVKEPKVVELYDLGIAKAHFEIGAQCGTWEFGNGGVFIKDDEK